MRGVHRESHLVDRIGWLRAAVLGANDGIVSTASLIVGVAAASAGRHEIVVAGVAALAAGAMSMAAGEYVSVSSQSDTEKADLDRERGELAAYPKAEAEELTAIYVARGLEPDLARRVAAQLMAKDALSAHARDELGISHATTARPIQAALTSAATFAAGASMPLATALVAPQAVLVPAVAAASLAFLALLGALGAKMGGADVLRATARVAFWGALALAVTAGLGRLFGAA
ncbi:MAG: putative nodulin-related protein [Caulobacteraceae bacterium]|nr:putative nodulin-related protein [Caulobacteraceae bacterium]